MDRLVIATASKEEWLKLRADDLTSTDMAALFGLSPYMTPYELWHRKHNKTIGGFEESERMKWGTRLQDSIAAGIAEDKGWEIQRYEQYQRIKGLRLGSSFDFFCYAPEVNDPPTAKDGLIHDFILEIKNVDSLAFKQGWVEDEQGNLEAPLHIEIQVQHQLLVSGLSKAFIGALVGGNRVVLIERKADPTVHESIIAKAKEFWRTIDANEEPKPDFKRDADFIKSLYQSAEPGTVMTATDRIIELATAYKSVSEIIKRHDETKAGYKAEILTLIGDVEKVKGEMFTISAGLTGPAHIEAYERAGFRNFKVTFKKEPKNA
jgi:putative phage-type endonuclease